MNLIKVHGLHLLLSFFFGVGALNKSLPKIAHERFMIARKYMKLAVVVGRWPLEIWLKIYLSMKFLGRSGR